MHFLFSLLRIKCLYMFWALLAHPQEFLPKRHLVNCVRVMSVGCTRMELRYMFRALLAHPQEVLQKRHLVYCVRVMSVGCTRIGAPLHVSSTTFSSSGGATKAKLYILHACYVSWLHQDWSGAPILLQLTDITRMQYTKCRYCSPSWGWARNAPKI
jgi:hypothetical protein